MKAEGWCAGCCEWRQWCGPEVKPSFTARAPLPPWCFYSWMRSHMRHSLLGLTCLTCTQSILQEVISVVVDGCFLPGRLAWAEAADTGAVELLFCVWSCQSLDRTTKSTQEDIRIWYHHPLAGMLSVKPVTVSGNTWSSSMLILFHVPGAFTSELLRDLQEGEKWIKRKSLFLKCTVC